MNKNITLFVLLLLGLSSCKKDWNSRIESQTSGNIRFQIGFAQDKENKATSRPNSKTDFNSSFIAGDTIGIFAVPTGQNLDSAGNPIHNIPLIFDGTSWKINVKWPSSAANFDFYAYFPYRAQNIDPRNFNFASRLDQHQTADFAASDLLWARATNIPVGNQVTLQFQHLMAMLQIEIPPSDLTGVGPDEILQCDLLGVSPSGKLNLQQGTFDKTNLGSANIAMFRIEKLGDNNYNTSFTYRALLPRQSISPQKPLLLLKQPGQSKIHKLAASITLSSGQLQRIEVKSNFIKTAYIPEGTFLMGDTVDNVFSNLVETPQHWVKLTKGFYMSKYEITCGQYVEFLNAVGAIASGNFVNNPLKDTEQWLQMNLTINGITRPNDQFIVDAGFKNKPVVYVSWYGAMAYAKWVGGTLPTEAQWEYAARAGTDTRYFFEGTNLTLNDVGWINESVFNGTHEVGTKMPNPWGLYDIYGNLWEWCLDSPTAYPSGSVIDPNNFADNDNYVILRGGAYFNLSSLVNSTARIWQVKSMVNAYIGIRLVFQP